MHKHNSSYQFIQLHAPHLSLSNSLIYFFSDFLLNILMNKKETVYLSKRFKELGLTDQSTEQNSALRVKHLISLGRRQHDNELNQQPIIFRITNYKS